MNTLLIAGSKRILRMISGNSMSLSDVEISLKATSCEYHDLYIVSGHFCINSYTAASEMDRIIGACW